MRYCVFIAFAGAAEFVAVAHESRSVDRAVGQPGAVVRQIARKVVGDPFNGRCARTVKTAEGRAVEVEDVGEYAVAVQVEKCESAVAVRIYGCHRQPCRGVGSRGGLGVSVEIIACQSRWLDD